MLKKLFSRLKGCFAKSVTSRLQRMHGRLNRIKFRKARVCIPAILLALFLVPLVGFATADASISLGSISTALTSTVTHLGTILVNISVISGVGFICVAFFKFHAHRNNPQQVPLGQGIGLLVIGAGLTLFPHLLTGVTQAGFGTSTLATAGSSISAIIKPA